MRKNDKRRYLQRARFEEVKAMFAPGAFPFRSPVCFYRGESKDVQRSLRKTDAKIGCYVQWSMLYREDMPKEIPEWEIFDLSKDRGWAELLGYSASNFSNFLSGKRSIPPDSLKLISNLTGLSIKYLCGESDTPTEEQEAREKFKAEQTRDEILYQALSVSITGKAVPDTSSLWFPVQYSPRAFEVAGEALDGMAMGALLDAIEAAIRSTAQTFLAGYSSGTKGPLQFNHAILPDDDSE